MTSSSSHHDDSKRAIATGAMVFAFGPPIGWTLVFIFGLLFAGATKLAAGEYDFAGPSALLGIWVVGVLYSYVFGGGVAALIAGIAVAWRIAVQGTVDAAYATRVGASASAVSGMLLVAYSGETNWPGSLRALAVGALIFGALGGLTGLVCWRAMARFGVAARGRQTSPTEPKS